MSKHIFTLVSLTINTDGVEFTKEQFAAKRINRMPTASYLSTREKKRLAVRYSHPKFLNIYLNGYKSTTDNAKMIHESDFGTYLECIFVNDRGDCNRATIFFKGEPTMGEDELREKMLERILDSCKRQEEQAQRELEQAQRVATYFEEQCHRLKLASQPTNRQHIQLKTLEEETK